MACAVGSPVRFTWLAALATMASSWTATAPSPRSPRAAASDASESAWLMNNSYRICLACYTEGYLSNGPPAAANRQAPDHNRTALPAQPAVALASAGCGRGGAAALTTSSIVH